MRLGIKKTIPKNNSEAIEMLASVVAYLKINSKKGTKDNSSVRNAEKPTIEKKSKREKGLQAANVIDLFASKGKETLIEHLKSLDISGLKKIISAYGFDKSRISKEWRDKDKFVNLIVDRVESIINKGDAFKD
jgi:hypothetical protein